MYKKNILITGLIPVIIAFSCSSGQMKAGNIEKTLNETADKINSNSEEILKLDTKGYPGYYYILDMQGKILYHPEKSLINWDFSRYSFVKKILQEKNGSFSLEINNKDTSVFYRELKNGTFLCYTIENSEYTID